MSLLNYSTKKTPSETIGEMQEMLSPFNVSAIMTEYDGRQVSAVAFRMSVQGREMAYRLPCNWRAVYEIFKTDKNVKAHVALANLETQAIRTAWRIIHRWLEAQLALVEVNMATIPQIFLPYTIMKDNRTLAEHVADNPALLLN